MEEEKKFQPEPLAGDATTDQTVNNNQSNDPTIKPVRIPLSLVSSSFGHPLLNPPLHPSNNQSVNPCDNQPMSPPEMMSPLSSNVSDSDDDTDSDDDAGKLARSQALYERPLIYNKRISSLVDQSKIDLHAIPSQIFLPDGSQMIGLPYQTVKQNDGENERNFMIFSLPTEEMRARRRVMGMLLYALLPIDIALCCVIYANADWLQSASFSDGEFSVESFVTVLLMCVLCGLAVYHRGTRLLTLASCLFCIDACINLLRCFNVVQIAHFVLEFTIAAVAMHFKQCCQPTWFTPRL